jgi:hypothetical protein
MPATELGKYNLVWSSFLFIASGILAFSLTNTLRSGVAKGRGGLEYDRDKQPFWYWTSVAVTAAVCGYFLFRAVRSL